MSAGKPTIANRELYFNADRRTEVASLTQIEARSVPLSTFQGISACEAFVQFADDTVK